MKTSVVTDISQCKKLWDEFSPNASIWDLWETNFSLYNPRVHNPHFIKLSGNKGVLPLWYDKHYKKYYFFGGTYPENRNFWFHPKYFPEVYSDIPEPCALTDITEESVSEIINLNPECKTLFPESEKDYSYSLDLVELNHDLQTYLKTFSPKHRKNILYEIRKLISSGYNMEWSDDAGAIEKLIELNKLRFGEESDFNDGDVLEDFMALISFLSNSEALMISVVTKDADVVGVEAGFTFEDTYYLLNGGFDPSHKNIGKWMILEHIKKAIELGNNKMDFLVGDSSGWKKLWNLTETPVFTTRKGVVRD